MEENNMRIIVLFMILCSCAIAEVDTVAAIKNSKQIVQESAEDIKEKASSITSEIAILKDINEELRTRNRELAAQLVSLKDVNKELSAEVKESKGVSWWLILWRFVKVLFAAWVLLIVILFIRKKLFS